MVVEFLTILRFFKKIKAAKHIWEPCFHLTAQTGQMSVGQNVCWPNVWWPNVCWPNACWSNVHQFIIYQTFLVNTQTVKKVNLTSVGQMFLTKRRSPPKKFQKNKNKIRQGSFFAKKPSDGWPRFVQPNLSTLALLKNIAWHREPLQKGKALCTNDLPLR